MNPDQPDAAKSHLDSATWWYLTRLHEEGIAEPDEIVVDVERAALETTPGAVVVTDRRVLFYRSSPYRRSSRAVSVALGDITEVEVRERRSPIKKRGVLTISSDHSGSLVNHVFEHIPEVSDGLKSSALRYANSNESLDLRLDRCAVGRGVSFRLLARRFSD